MGQLFDFLGGHCSCHLDFSDAFSRLHVDAKDSYPIPCLLAVFLMSQMAALNVTIMIYISIYKRSFKSKHQFLA